MGRFRFEDDYRCLMPAHFGGHRYETSNTVYRDVTNLVIQYRTDKEAIDCRWKSSRPPSSPGVRPTC